ncbi:MAG: DUF1460 domain-containing protein [Prevotella sp.]|nr:DUF1460 domain-containing protein [Prevotella sp.]
MRKGIITVVLMLLTLAVGEAHAQAIQYEQADSLQVMQLLSEARGLTNETNWMLHFGRRLRGIPYVAKTLEKNEQEQLVVNLRQLDCTTFVESVLALALCRQNGQYQFKDYCEYLRKIRYREGTIGYPTRLHYFSEWIADNTRMGFVRELQGPNPPFTRIQTLQTDYMTQHVSQYPMLVRNPSWVEEISSMEQALCGQKVRYIPKESIRNTRLFRQTIHNGDIIAITTSKKGLDTSHIGIAVWHKDGLHLLNASQIRKKVVEEPMTLYTYMQKHPSQVGIRIVSVVRN